MAYRITDDTVRWLEKPIKGVRAQGVTVLGDDRFATTPDVVLMKGKATPASVDGFRLLSPTYAADKTTVFQIMDTKLKPLPNIDATTFEAVGECFGRDAHSAWFEAKQVKKANPAGLRALHAQYATDGDLLFKAHNVIKPYAGQYPLDLARARMLVQSGPYSEYDFVIWDSAGAFFVQAYDWPSIWTPVETDRPENLRFLNDPTTMDRSSVWLGDDARVFWFGTALTGAAPDDITLLSDTVAISGGQVFLGDTADPEIDAASLIALDQLGRYADKNALWYLRGGRRLGRVVGIDRERIAARVTLQGDPDEVLQAFYRSAFLELFGLFSALWPDTTEQNLPSCTPDTSVLDDVTIQRSGTQITATLGGNSVAGQPADWYRIACLLWTGQQGRQATLLHFPTLSSTGTRLQGCVLWVAGNKMLLAAQAWLDLGHEEQAQHLAAQALVEVFGAGNRLLEKLDVGDLAQVDPALLRNAHHPLFYGQFSASTYLAAARKTLETGGLTDPDFRTRWGAVAFLHYMISETTQQKHYLNEILPPLVDLVETEQVGFIRDHALCTLDAGCRFLASERNGLQKEGIPFLERLISEGVNTDLNMARLAAAQSA